MLASTKKESPPRSARIVAEVVRQHAELVAFLWGQREGLAAEDPPDSKAIGSVETRLEVNLDGLRIAGAAAWPYLYAQYEDFPEKGELFALAWMALEFADLDQIERVIGLGAASEECAAGLLGALAWHRPETIAAHVRVWIAAQDPFRRYLGVSACLAHLVDPRGLLLKLVHDGDPRVSATAVRLTGKLRRSDLAREVRQAMEVSDANVKLWASWALTELGAGDVVREELRRIVTDAGPNAQIALRALIKAGPEKDVRVWIGGLMRSLNTASLGVRGIGMLGDGSVLPWLIDRMREPPLAAAAGAALVELFPASRDEDDLFTLDPQDAGTPFAKHYEDAAVRLPLADKVAAWATSQGLLMR